MDKLNSKVDEYIIKYKKWSKELDKLRKIVLECNLTEEFKWRNPCYTFEENNVIILGVTKDFCNISFLKGSLLKDSKGILEKPGENTRASRLIRFKDVQEINKIDSVIKSYIKEAIEIEKSGLKVDFEKDADLEIPEELKNKLEKDSNFNAAFNSLTPGRQRGYIIYFSGAKQSKSREARIEKYIHRILDGKGIYDCVCGLSKKMPNCDGSHKKLKQ